MHRRTWMKRISLPIIALGLLVSGSPAYAEDDVLKFLFDTDIIDEAHKVASFYSDVNNLWDAGKKVAEFLGWLKADATTADVLKMLSKIDDDIAAMYIGEHNDYVKGKIHDQLDIFRVTFNHLKSGVKLEKGKYDDDDTAKAAGKLLDHQLFLRLKEGKDDGLLKRFNYPCDRPCVYTEATLGLEAGN